MLSSTGFYSIISVGKNYCNLNVRIGGDDMKKRLAIGLSAVVLFLSLSACGSKEVVGVDDDAAGKVKIVDIELTEERYGIGVDKDKGGLLAAVNAYISEAKESGELDEIIDRNMNGGEAKLVLSAEPDDTRDQLVVASTLDFEPFEYGEVGEYYGIDMEIIERLAEYLNKDLVIVNSSFETMFLSVKQHKCDICIGGISITDARKEYVDFSDPYYTTAQSLIVPLENTEFDQAQNAEDVEAILRTKDAASVIGVENLTTAQIYCEGGEDFEGFPATIKGYKDIETALGALVGGECQYVVADHASAKRFVDKINGEQ